MAEHKHWSNNVLCLPLANEVVVHTGYSQIPLVSKFPGQLVLQTPLLKGEGQEVVRAAACIPLLWLLIASISCLSTPSLNTSKRSLLRGGQREVHQHFILVYFMKHVFMFLSRGGGGEVEQDIFIPLYAVENHCIFISGAPAFHLKAILVYNIWH